MWVCGRVYVHVCMYVWVRKTSLNLIGISLSSNIRATSCAQVIKHGLGVWENRWRGSYFRAHVTDGGCCEKKKEKKVSEGDSAEGLCACVHVCMGVWVRACVRAWLDIILSFFSKLKKYSITHSGCAQSLDALTKVLDHVTGTTLHS